MDLPVIKRSSGLPDVIHNILDVPGHHHGAVSPASLLQGAAAADAEGAA